MSEHHALWRAEHTTGVDVCRWRGGTEGWLLDGHATFVSDGDIASVAYRLSFRDDWTTEAADVSGYVGERQLELSITRHLDGQWVSNGEPLQVDSHEALADLDLGFTPATNTNALRRLAIEPGSVAETTALWLDTDDWQFKPLVQTYERLDQFSYHYRSPRHDYAADLVVDDFGVVDQYPDLWHRIG